MNKLYLLVLLCLMCFGSCSPKIEIIQEKVIDSLELYIQPYNISNSKQVIDFKDSLQIHLNEIITKPTNIIILPNIQLDDSLKATSIKYKASTILQNQVSMNLPGPVIGFTNYDISTRCRGIDNWGVLGLAFLNKNTCIVSTYRLKDKSLIWKVGIHELMHAHYGLRHCPNDSDSCIMKDAKGKANFKNKDHLCDTCKKLIYD